MALASPPSSARWDRSSRRGSGRRAPAGAGVSPPVNPIRNTRVQMAAAWRTGIRWRGAVMLTGLISPVVRIPNTYGVLAGSRCLGRWGTVPGRDTGRPPDGGIRLGPCGGPNRAGVTLGRSHRPHSDRPCDTATAIGWRITWVIRPTYDLSVGGDPLADSTGDHLHPSPADSPRSRRFPGGQSPGTDAVVVTRMVTRPNVPAHVGL